MNDNIKTCIYFPIETFTIFFCKLGDFVKNIKKLPNFNISKLDIKTNWDFFVSEFTESTYNDSNKKYFFSPITNNDITLFVTNQPDGAYTWVNIINNGIKGDSISITSSFYYNEYKMYKFNYYKGGDSIRYVRSMQDPRWEFYEEGTSLWFEDIELYKQRMIKKRMNLQVIDSYLKKMGINIFDENFLKNEETIYELT